jgi:uncharacterized protein YcfL
MMGEDFMRTLCVMFLALLLAGCASSPPAAGLTAEEAKALAMQFANEKAFRLYRVQPYRDGQPARFKSGHWIWTDRRGVGQMDMQVTVELAADGSTNRVDLNVFDSMYRPMGPQTITK